MRCHLGITVQDFSVAHRVLCLAEVAAPSNRNAGLLVFVIGKLILQQPGARRGWLYCAVVACLPAVPERTCRRAGRRPSICFLCAAWLSGPHGGGGPRAAATQQTLSQLQRGGRELPVGHHVPIFPRSGGLRRPSRLWPSLHRLLGHGRRCCRRSRRARPARTGTRCTLGAPARSATAAAAAATASSAREAPTSDAIAVSSPQSVQQ